MNKHVLSIFVTVWLAYPHTAAAQSDVGLWLELGAKTELHDRVEVGLSQNLRFDHDVSRVSAVMPGAGLEVELADFLEVGLGYRYEYERGGDGDFEHNHRGNVDAELGVDIGPVGASYRLRYQQHIATGENRRVRNRLEVNLDLDRRWEPYGSAEIYHDVEGANRGLHKTRFTLGVDFKWRDQKVDTFYRIEVPRDAMDPILHIVGLELSTEL